VCSTCEGTRYRRNFINSSSIMYMKLCDRECFFVLHNVLSRKMSK
jgi:hypothetical protein